MSSDDQDDDINIVTPQCGEYAASESNTSCHRVKAGKTRLSEAEILCCDAIEHYNVDPMVYLKTPQEQKRHVFKKSLFSSLQDEILMSASVDPIKELSDQGFTEEQVHLIPKFPGQTSDEIKVPTREVFEYAYNNFTDSKVRQYLQDVQQWLYFIRYHKKPDCSIPILDHTGKAYTEVTNWTLQYIDTLPANAKKCYEIQLLKKNHPISVLTDTSKTSKTEKPTTSQTAKPIPNPTQTQPIPIAQAIATAVHKDIGASGSPPPSPPTPHRSNTLTSSPNSSPDRLHSLRNRATDCILQGIELYSFLRLHLMVRIKLKLVHIYKVLKIL